MSPEAIDGVVRRRVAGRAPRFHILMIASEASPWAKSGGLGDVLAGLPSALDALGHRVTIVMPRYRHIVLSEGESIARRITVGAIEYDVTLHVVPLPRARRVIFVDCPPLFDREGYYGAGGVDFVDNDRRFAALCVAALDFAEHVSHEPVDIVHAHDWQAGLAPLWLHAEPQRWPRLANAARVLTIHNLAYQGLFPASSVPALGLPWEIFRLDAAEFWGKFGLLKAGINFSDMVTTVSPTYARETLTPEWGSGLDGVLHARGDRYVGILNGIDADEWNPASDPRLPAHYDVDQLDGKRACKRALLERFHLPVGDDAMDRPLIGMVSRLVEQKGLDLVMAASDALFKADAAWVFVGSGDSRFEDGLRALAAEYPSRVGVAIGFDEGLAHLVEAGADMFLMPSNFEPCGLNQMYSLRYGTVPIVQAVGGLDDTIQPYSPRARRANGFKFRGATAEALARTVVQAIRVFADSDAWRRLMRQGMTENHAWEISAKEYVRVYRRARQEAVARSQSRRPLDLS